ncbi:MAG: bifunctional lysylphosphatidylglycerol flippase/synthetase MprF [Enterococcus sp.]
MKTWFDWLKKHSGFFKTIFLASVLVIVLAEVLAIGKTISFQQLESILKNVPVWKISLMLIIGLVSVVPMIGYDILLNRLLGNTPSKRYLFETSWLINTINNIAGFGGLVSIGLRSELYGRGNENKQVIHALSKILFFLMSGLSIYSLSAFFILLFDSTGAYVQQYWIWLIGGGLYFPILLILTSLRKTGLLGGLDRGMRMQLVAVSFLEWTGVLFSFFSIGALMGISFHFTQVLPLFIAASVIGIVSMIPGELGSFDVMMILGLASIGIPKETVVAWILLYRIFYYIIPFFIGGIFFIKNIGASIDQRYDGVPRELLTEFAHKLVVFLLYFSGIMLLLSATIPEAFIKFSWLRHLNPLNVRLISEFPSILLGFLLMIMGRGIAARVKRAYTPTIVLISITLIYLFITGLTISTLILLAILIVAIALSKSELFREQLVYSWEWLTIDGLLFGALSILYIIIGMYNLPHHPHPHHHHYFSEFFLFPSEKIWFSGLIAILIVSFFIILFVRFLQGKKLQPGQSFDEARVNRILMTYGGNADSQLVFLKDKRVFFYSNAQEDTVFLQFASHNNKCVVMGDPSGNPEDFPNAIEAFIAHTDRLGFTPVFYEVSEEIVMILHEFGYDFIKMGEEAHVCLSTFTTSGKKMKGTRAIVNRFTKEGYRFEVLTPPFDSNTLYELQQISDTWLHGRKEKGFSLGFFSEDYLQRAPIAVIRDSENEIIAFANFMPTYTNHAQGSIDLMRYDTENAPSGTMDYLFIHLFEYMKQQGFTSFNLGMAPLANVGTSKKSFFQERIAYLVYQFGSHFYSFQGLRDYKEKYATNWVSRYTLYSRKSWIAYVMAALLIIDNAPVQMTKETAAKKEPSLLVKGS